MGKTSRFNDEEDTFIINYMYYMEKNYNSNRPYNKVNCFKKISKFMPEYTPKQISNHWKNHLYPNLCHDPLWKSKKDSIIKYIEWIHKRSKSKMDGYDVLHMLKIWIEKNYYNYENNVYCEKNQSRKHLNKRRPEDKVRNSSQKINSSNSKKVAPQNYHIKKEHQKFILPFPSSNNIPSYTPSSPPQNYHIKQEHQKFILPLPSSDNVPSYSQNDSSSRIPIESLLNEVNCSPEINEVAKEYYSTI
ncbi:hypothetical protein C1646_739095 [Rhizophagus diaphanus]|nr:hypothetical protein C1646_739095 [Rhizophagus diaphanus] [Rhizophagus sp. MUCL 43196]